ncbi:uncharacterized protein LOC130791411 [Actinidia eriantha]|uniref:uncharacterized protein LOC130791411 n=1 Tax=Actinidia eriantha TaxID=165200 RepID=UPI002583DD1B|nr:uncharacterized protein LOC130791411 [Actinidia eriantha]
MVDLANTTSGITRLNNHNYQSWRSRIKSYLEGQDLWEVVGGDSTQPPKEAEALRKWKIKVGKAMYVLKTTIEDELLGRIRDDDSPKMAWDTFASLFSKTNDARLQYLENELMSTTQGSKSISEYFTKIKDLCREISDLDPKANIREERMRRIIIHGLKPEYNAYITMAGVSVKNEEEALYSNNKKGGYYRHQNKKAKKVMESSRTEKMAQILNMGKVLG